MVSAQCGMFHDTVWCFALFAWLSAVTRLSLIMPTHFAQIKPVSVQETTLPVRKTVPPLK